jgi:hypothetical protein
MEDQQITDAMLGSFPDIAAAALGILIAACSIFAMFMIYELVRRAMQSGAAADSESAQRAEDDYNSLH